MNVWIWAKTRVHLPTVNGILKSPVASWHERSCHAPGRALAHSSRKKSEPGPRGCGLAVSHASAREARPGNGIMTQLKVLGEHAFPALSGPLCALPRCHSAEAPPPPPDPHLKTVNMLNLCGNTTWKWVEAMRSGTKERTVCTPSIWGNAPDGSDKLGMRDRNQFPPPLSLGDPVGPPSCIPRSARSRGGCESIISPVAGRSATQTRATSDDVI